MTTPHHDANTFIQHGVNGFLIRREPEEVAVLIESLLNNPHHAIAIGNKGKETAQQLFNWNRFAHEWEVLLDNVLSSRSSMSS